LSEFVKNSKKRSHIGDGHENRCKKCLSDYNKTPMRVAATKAKDAIYRKRPENIAKRKIANKKYAKTEKGIINRSKAFKKYCQTKKYKDAINKFRLKYPEQRKANIIITNALSSEKIIRPTSCSLCKKPCIPQGHHPDYSKPLEVVWVCKDCHTGIHWQ